MERELLLLGLLQRQDMHGYQLHDFIESYMQTCVDIKKSTAYYLLEKMAQEGWLEYSEIREGNRPPRRVYSVTEAGEEQFQTLLRQNLAAYQPARFSSNIGLTFLDQLPREEAITLLNQRKAALKQLYEDVKQAPPHKGSLQLLVSHQVMHLEAELNWLSRIIEQLQQEGPGATK